jgi:hypothetical protein
MDLDILYCSQGLFCLIGIAVSDRLCAPVEHFSQLFDSPSLGATLLRLDRADTRGACGFNRGTIGIPKLGTHAHSLELIRKIIENLLAVRGRNGLNWVDQEVANYVSFRIAHFDTHHLSKCVRYGDETDALRLGPLTGLVHFWCVLHKRDRPKVMRRYLDLLLPHVAAASDGGGGSHSRVRD